jgi:hypothetical protein
MKILHEYLTTALRATGQINLFSSILTPQGFVKFGEWISD